MNGNTDITTTGIVIAIVVCIIIIQVCFFVGNVCRMVQFKKIFSKHESWETTKGMGDMVNGISGEGDNIFKSIVVSINKYLSNNTGSVIDFDLLKDSVDRHCDAVENDIAMQTPIPLYCGLAGTMFGVIVGLFDLLNNNAILTLMANAEDNMGQATEGIEGLLNGIAWAMVASIFGIILTTLNTFLFQRFKLAEESGKNSFLAWMQSTLLPELPQDTSQALTNLVKNLNKFNNTFSQNTAGLGEALQKVNESYAIQARIIEAVHDMDVVKMAKANVKVLQELQDCTDKLETFNEYLNDIEGYTVAIHRFEQQFQREESRLHILEEIRDFFVRHKGEIAKTTADAGNALEVALKSIKDSTSTNVSEVQAVFVKQCETLKDVIKKEREEFEKLAKEVRTQFSAQMANMPQVAKQMDMISQIPHELSDVVKKINTSNSDLLANIDKYIKQLQSSKSDSSNRRQEYQMSPWMLKTGWIAIVVIAIACLINVTATFVPLHSDASLGGQSAQITNMDADTTTFVPLHTDASTIEEPAQITNIATATNQEDDGR